jgi:transposase
MRYELSDGEWATIRPMLPNKARGVPLESDRLMGVCVHPMAELRHNSCPLVTAPLESQRPCP